MLMRSVMLSLARSKSSRRVKGEEDASPKGVTNKHDRPVCWVATPTTSYAADGEGLSYLLNFLLVLVILLSRHLDVRALPCSGWLFFVVGSSSLFSLHPGRYAHPRKGPESLQR
jgi:hypothetical protein